MKKLFLSLTTIFIFSFLLSQHLTTKNSIQVDNFHAIDTDVFRSGQPDKEEFKALEKSGIKQILNLRNYHSDDDEAKNTSLILSRVKMNAGSLTEEELLDALKIIRDRKGPILIHCLHGSDRTGAVVALYRVVFQGWNKEKAVEELKDDKYGHHEWYFKNIPELIDKIDIQKFKTKLASMK